MNNVLRFYEAFRNLNQFWNITLALCWKSFTYFGVPVKNGQLFKMYLKHLIVPYHHQISDSVFLSTCFLSIRTGFAFLFGTDWLQASLIWAPQLLSEQKNVLIILSMFTHTLRCNSSNQWGLWSNSCERKYKTCDNWFLYKKYIFFGTCYTLYKQFSKFHCNAIIFIAFSGKNMRVKYS